MKIGLVGYQGSGKSTLFEWLTAREAGPGPVARRQRAIGPPFPSPAVVGYTVSKKVTPLGVAGTGEHAGNRPHSREGSGPPASPISARAAA